MNQNAENPSPVALSWIRWVVKAVRMKNWTVNAKKLRKSIFSAVLPGANAAT
ncbi:hypothetical protein HED49_21800 [Ochrobactrum daejeonense]|nr:hypothetical protein [Brucella daejeonensis]